ncbi:MAG TPA: Fe-S cluster assembly protein SufB, partial [Candidatus Nanoarchaeia archaeon]|nr:Fe-S cluster assembly protein SufB [Candidatus Nanoarchaeia archaeon]
WMLNKRLEGLKLWNETGMPKWGPDLSKLNTDEIIFYVDPNTKETTDWKEVPEEIRKTFDKLGIPEAEKKVLSGVGAQYDSNVVYHNLQKQLQDKGVIFENMDVAVEKYPELVKKYFMTSCIPINTHKFIMLHAAVWSGGTFIYVPKNVKVDLPLQAYFRMNAQKGGQFEHTLIIIDEGAELHYIEGCSSPRYQQSSLHAGCVEIHVLENGKMKYTSIENWSKNVYNLNTKRAIVQKNAFMQWVNGNMGSTATMLYPMSVLVGEGASTDNIGIAFAGAGQNQDTGSKVLHLAPNTSSTIHSKSICRGGGITTYRGLVQVHKNASNSRSTVTCDALILDNLSASNTIPLMKIDNNKVHIGHEATVGKIGEEEIFYLMSRGLSRDESIKMIVSGFIAPVVSALPLEYAVELNKLIEIEIEGF